MKTVFLIYRKIRYFDAYPIAIDHDESHALAMSQFDGVGYVELPYNDAKYVYDNKLDVLNYMKENSK